MNAADRPGGGILVVEDRATLRRMLVSALEAEGFEVDAVGEVAPALERFENRRFDVVLTDLKLPDGSGIDVLRRSRELHPTTPVVVLTGFGTVTAAVEAMKLGAADFLEKPVEVDDLYELVRGLLGTGGGDSSVEIAGGPTVVGRHPSFLAAFRLLRRVAATETTVLLTGESGTGKEVFARALHALSGRAAGPFVAVNCAAIPEALIESELFGHEKGSFTGAARRQAGRFESAAGGTLLLDEIGDLGLGIQAKILRVLEERRFERIGGGRTLEADARVVAATNRDLGRMVEAGEFRSDLFHRLDVFPIRLPPLRERGADVSLLSRHLLERLASRHHVTPPALTPEAEGWLEERDWPGNVRQLSNVLERCVILHPGDAIEVSDLRRCLDDGAGQEASGGGERERVIEALRRADGNKKRAAEALGISYRTLQRRITEFDLEGIPHYRET